jgi:membrane protein
LTKLSRREWVTRLADDAAPRYVLIANPAQVTVGRLFDVFVIDRPELEYQLRLDSTRVDTALLLDALHNPKLDLTLAVLVAARSARGALDGSGKAVRSHWPHQPA